MKPNGNKIANRNVWLLIAVLTSCAPCSGPDIPHWEVGARSDNELMCRCEIRMTEDVCKAAKLFSDNVICHTQTDQPICIPSRLVNSKLGEKEYRAALKKLCAEDYRDYLIALGAELDWKNLEKRNGCSAFETAQHFVDVACYPSEHPSSSDSTATALASPCAEASCDRIPCTPETCKRHIAKPTEDTSEINLTPCECTAPSACGKSGFICTGTATAAYSSVSSLEVLTSPLFSTLNDPIIIELWPVGSYMDVTANYEAHTATARAKISGRIQLYGHCVADSQCIRKLEGHLTVDPFTLRLGSNDVHIEGGTVILRTDLKDGVVFSSTGEGIIQEQDLLASATAYIDAPSGIWDRARSRYHTEVRNDKQTIDLGIDLAQGGFSLRNIGFQTEHGQATVRLTGFIIEQPPTAIINGQQTYEATGPEGADISLSGWESFKPRGRTPFEFLPHQALLYNWWTDEPFYGTLIGRSPNLSRKSPLGRKSYYLTVRDLAGTVSVDSVIVDVRDTTPPHLRCPSRLVVEASSPEGTPVPYSITASDLVSEPRINYSQSPGAMFPIGTTVVEVQATDTFGNSSTCNFPVLVRDTIPPSLSVELRQDCLWPPLADMALFEVGKDIMVEAKDGVDPSPKVRIVGVESNQVERKLFPISPDIAYGDSAFCVRVENERGFLDSPRKYSVEIEASDQSGNTTNRTVDIDVPFLWKGCDQLALNTRRFVSKDDPRCTAP